MLVQGADLYWPFTLAAVVLAVYMVGGAVLALLHE